MYAARPSFLASSRPRIGIAGGTPSSGRYAAILKSIGLGSPGQPTIMPGPGKYFEIGTFAERFDALVGLVRFPAVFPPRRDN
jgi:hypothetical protein